MKKSKAIGVSLLWILLFFGIQVILSVAVTIGGSLGNMSGNALETAVGSIQKTLVLSNLITILLVPLIVKLNGETWSGSLGLRRAPFSGIIISALLAVTLSPLISYILEIIPIPEVLEEFYDEMMESVVGNGSYLSMTATVLFAPICEELVFRGAIFNTLRKSFSTVSSAIICALLFGLIHLNPIQSSYAFILGLILCFICVRFNSLWASVVFHIVFNLIGGYADLTAIPEKYILIILIAAAVTAAVILIWMAATNRKKSKRK